MSQGCKLKGDDINNPFLKRKPLEEKKCEVNFSIYASIWYLGFLFDK